MTRLATRLQTVGLVSMAHTRDVLEQSQDLANAGVRLYLWESPWLDAVLQPVGSRLDWKRRVRRWIRDAVATWRAGGRPADTWIMDAAFANMAPGLTKALAERSWHAVAVVQSSAAAMIDRVPRHLVSVLVMHDIRARLFSSTGTALTTDIQVHTSSSSAQSGSSVTALSGGGFVVTWTSGGVSGDSDLAIMAQVFSAAGTKVARLRHGVRVGSGQIVQNAR